MSVQYRDGSFGPTLPFDEAHAAFLDACMAGTAKALHVGSFQEVEQAKVDANVKAKMEALGVRLAELEAQTKSSPIAKLTWDQIQQFTK